VGIDRDAGRDAEGLTEHHLGGLPADTWECHECLEVGRNLAAVLRHELSSSPLNRTSLVAEETGRPDHVLELAEIRYSNGRRYRPTAKQLRRDLIHPLVRALR